MNTTAKARLSVAGTAARRPRHGWRVQAFVVVRREDRSGGAYRSVVYTPLPESADLGVGLSPDEVARRVPVGFWDNIGVARRAKPEEIADFWENVGVTVRGGGTEAVALSRATRMASTPRMRGVLGAVRWRMNQGRALHAALAEFPEIFQRAHCALAEAATELPPEERSALYLSLAKTLREESSRGRRFLATMLDQIITAVMLIGLVLITILFFVPNFVSMFRGMDLALPWPYRMAELANLALRNYSAVVLPLAAGLAVAAYAGVRRLQRSRTVQCLVARCWGIGSVVRNLALSRSLPLFAVLHKAGVHPETIFRLSGESSGNALVEDFFRAAYARCAAGMDLEKSFLAERMRLGLDEGRRLAGKVEAGGELGDLEGVLRGLAEEFSERANAKIDALPKIVKPLNLAAMGLVVGMMAALVGLPSMLVLEKTLQQQNATARTRYDMHSKTSP